MTNETNAQEAQPPTTNNGDGNKSSATPLLDGANQAAERLEKAAAQSRQESDRLEKLLAQLRLGGGSVAGQSSAPETEEEKIRRQAREDMGRFFRR